MWCVQSYTVSSFVFHLIHLLWCVQGSSVLQRETVHLFFLWPTNIPLYRSYYVFSSRCAEVYVCMYVCKGFLNFNFRVVNIQCYIRFLCWVAWSLLSAHRGKCALGPLHLFHPSPLTSPATVLLMKQGSQVRTLVVGRVKKKKKVMFSFDWVLTGSFLTPSNESKVS